MKTIKVLLDFATFSVTEKITFYRNIIDKLTDNPAFTNPDVPLSEVKSIVDQFEASIVAARDGSHLAVSTMHDHEKTTVSVFKALAHYVDKIADGNVTLIWSSGFHQSSQPTPHKKPTLAVSDGMTSGSVKLVDKAIDKAGSYIFQMAKDTLPSSDNQWLPITTTTYSYFTVEGLSPASYYYFRVAAVTPEGIQDFCQPVEKLVI